MNREQAKKILPIIQAYLDGKTIQYDYTRSGKFNIEIGDDFDFSIIFCSPELFRIKPESKYRPFKDAEECWKEMQKHQPFGWVKDKKDGSRHLITLVEECGDVVIAYADNRTKHGVFLDFTFADGTPFGIEVEED